MVNLTWMDTNHPPFFEALNLLKIYNFLDYLFNTVIFGSSYWFLFCLALLFASSLLDIKRGFKFNKNNTSVFFKLSGSSLTILNLHLLIWFGSQFAGLCLVLFFGRFSVGGVVALYYFPLLQISSLFMCKLLF